MRVATVCHGSKTAGSSTVFVGSSCEKARRGMTIPADIVFFFSRDITKKENSEMNSRKWPFFCTHRDFSSVLSRVLVHFLLCCLRVLCSFLSACVDDGMITRMFFI